MWNIRLFLFIFTVALSGSQEVFPFQQKSWNIGAKTLELLDKQHLVLYNNGTRSQIRFHNPVIHFTRKGEATFAVQTKESYLDVEIDEQSILTRDSFQLPSISNEYSQVFHFGYQEQSVRVKIHHDNTYAFKYKKSTTDSVFIHSKLYLIDNVKPDGFNMSFDNKLKILYLQLPSSNQYLVIDFNARYFQFNFLENQNDVQNPREGLWFYDESEQVTYLFIKEGNRKGLYHAFKFKDGIPKPDKRNGQTLFHSKDWYDHDLFFGKYKTKPDFIRSREIWKDNASAGTINKF